MNEIVGGVMASIFSVLGMEGLDASDGEDGDPVSDLEVEVIVYELEG